MQRSVWNDIVRKFYKNMVGKSSKLRMFICLPRMRTIIIFCVRGRCQAGWEKAEH